MRIVLGIVGVVCAVAAGVLLATQTAPYVAVGLLVVGLVALLFTRGGAAGAGGPDGGG